MSQQFFEKKDINKYYQHSNFGKYSGVSIQESGQLQQTGFR
jgi:hypothetical protein